ncbi:MAG: adenylate/guanylate cyclase domain-containing protein [Oscillospiraceae bacterium]|nr:adenylate/guanylate cyclase domain-containing protein [Oscillospiraceae bacterium]
MKNKFLRTLLVSLLGAALLTAIAASPLLRGADGAVSDALYHREIATDGEIVLIGMDQHSLEELGPWPWPRDYMADVIAILNDDPETAPAVIGIDVLYVGESADPYADEYLTETAAWGENVVTAAAATFGSALVTDEDSFGMDTMAVLAWDAPFDALAAVTDTGHINAMADSDGVIRHAMLYVDTPDGERVYSFARVIYEKYAACHGLDVTPLPETDANGFFYLPYSAAPGGYNSGISFVDVLDGLVDPELFAGKIVLIGPYAAGLQDEYRTAIDHAAPMYGVEIQANQIDAYRNGNIPHEASDALQLALLFIISALMLLWLSDRKMIVSILTWLLVTLGWIGFCLLAYSRGIVLHALWIPLAATVSFVVSVAYNYIRAAKEKRRVTATFGRYVDPAILKELLVQGGSAEDLGGKMFNIAVLFVDVRGFTTMSEALDPPTVVEIINKYLTLTTECIMRHHGTLDKFVGDCTMAFWNAPLPQDDAIYLACRAAMDMVEGSKALGEELQQKFGRSVSFGIGVHYGPAVVGNIGAPKRMDYTAIGDTVNTSARLEANAPGGKILISRVVADALGDRAKVTSLGDSIKLKGKAEGFECLTLDELL